MGRQESGEEKWPCKKSSKAPVKRYVLKLQNLKMPRRTMTDNEQEGYVKVKIQETERVHESHKTRSLDEKGLPAAGFVLAVQRNI